MQARSMFAGAASALLILGVGGCPPPAAMKPFEPIPMGEAVRIVNRNAERIPGTLRAIGPVDGYFTTEDGRQRTFHADGVLFYLAPGHLRFDIKKFGDRQVFFGSNDTDYWFYTKEDDTYACGRHGNDRGVAADLPIRPDQIGDALGLGPITLGGPAHAHPPTIQRVVEEYQQILTLTYEGRRPILQKEFWLDRFRPQLVRRVVFRDAEGVVEMESRLDQFEQLSPDGPWLPTVMEAEWPKSDAQLRLRVRQWTLFEQVTANSIQFATPMECLDR